MFKPKNMLDVDTVPGLRELEDAAKKASLDKKVPLEEANKIIDAFNLAYLVSGGNIGGTKMSAEYCRGLHVGTTRQEVDAHCEKMKNFIKV